MRGRRSGQRARQRPAAARDFRRRFEDGRDRRAGGSALDFARVRRINFRSSASVSRINFAHKSGTTAVCLAVSTAPTVASTGAVPASRPTSAAGRKEHGVHAPSCSVPRHRRVGARRAGGRAGFRGFHSEPANPTRAADYARRSRAAACAGSRRRTVASNRRAAARSPRPSRAWASMNSAVVRWVAARSSSKSSIVGREVAK